MGVRLLKSSCPKGYRPLWYLYYKGEDGRIRYKATNVKVMGKPPSSLSMKDRGDDLYEKSRTLAEECLRRFLEERKVKGATDRLIETLIENKTGRKVEYARLDGMYEAWLDFPRIREVAEVRKQSTKAQFKRFTDFLASNPKWRGWKFLYEVTPKAAKAFIDSIKETFATSTVRDYRTLLSGTFIRLLPAGIQNPFKDIKVGSGTADDLQIHRAPLTNDELGKVYETAKASKDAWLYPITVCAAETGLRIGDVCLLKWKDVFLGEGHISTVTSKTGKLVHIPIFDNLRKVLESCLAEKDDGDEYVFYDAAMCYKYNRSGLIYRGKMLFAQALFGDRKPTEEPTEVIDGKPKPKMTQTEVLQAIDDCKRFFAAKKARAKEIYARFNGGETCASIARAMGMSAGQISGYLKDIEEVIGERIRPGLGKDITRLRVSLTQARHKTGKNAVSIYGWHTLRANYCVHAIYYHHIPENLVREVVGHSTMKVIRSYLNPTWKVYREAWASGNQKTQSVANPSEVISAMQLLTQSLSEEQIAAMKTVLSAVASTQSTNPPLPLTL